MRSNKMKFITAVLLCAGMMTCMTAVCNAQVTNAQVGVTTLGNTQDNKTQVAPASDGVQLLGKWTENFPNGKKMLVEFTDKTMSFTPVDQSGKAVKSVNTANVTFKKLEKSDKGEMISIKVTDKDGKPAGGFFALIKSADEVVLDMPGAGAYFLRRAK
jgi:hypothetical protein